MQFEVEQALNLDSAWRVIPVLAEAKMPAAKDLPTSIAQITTVQSAKLSRKTNEWGPGVRALHEEIDNGSVRPLPFYAKPGKRLVRLEHHKYPPGLARSDRRSAPSCSQRDTSCCRAGTTIEPGVLTAM